MINEKNHEKLLDSICNEEKFDWQNLKWQYINNLSTEDLNLIIKILFSYKTKTVLDKLHYNFFIKKILHNNKSPNSINGRKFDFKCTILNLIDEVIFIDDILAKEFQSEYLECISKTRINDISSLIEISMAAPKKIEIILYLSHRCINAIDFYIDLYNICDEDTKLKITQYVEKNKNYLNNNMPNYKQQTQDLYEKFYSAKNKNKLILKKCAIGLMTVVFGLLTYKQMDANDKRKIKDATLWI